MFHKKGNKSADNHTTLSSVCLLNAPIYFLSSNKLKSFISSKDTHSKKNKLGNKNSRLPVAGRPLGSQLLNTYNNIRD